jgi:hypothetical protein
MKKPLLIVLRGWVRTTLRRRKGMEVALRVASREDMILLVSDMMDEDVGRQELGSSGYDVFP